MYRKSEFFNSDFSFVIRLLFERFLTITLTVEGDRYKVRTPSFCNWPIVCHAVQSNIVPDFPLINKSFNLSYAGNDL